MRIEITRVEDVAIVHLEGHLNFETTEPFRRNYLEKLGSTKVIFHFGNLQFVGSSGISLFLELIKDFSHKTQQKPKFCNVGSELLGHILDRKRRMLHGFV